MGKMKQIWADKLQGINYCDDMSCLIRGCEGKHEQ